MAQVVSAFRSYQLFTVAAVALLVLLVVMEALLLVVMAVTALHMLLVALLPTTLAVVPLTYGRVRVEVLRRELLDLAAVVQVITLLVELMQPQIRVAVEEGGRKQETMEGERASNLRAAPRLLPSLLLLESRYVFSLVT